MTEETKQEERPQVVSDAIQAAERLEKANAETKELLKQAERLEAFRALGGKSEGALQQSQPKEIDAREYARAALTGRLIPKV